jgi:hypothetical protein
MRHARPSSADGSRMQKGGWEGAVRGTQGVEDPIQYTCR